MDIVPFTRQAAEALDPVDMDAEVTDTRLYKVDPNPTDENEMQEEQDLIRATYGKFFQNNKQFEHFAMLPIRADDRMEFIKMAHKYQAEHAKDGKEEEEEEKKNKHTHQ